MYITLLLASTVDYLARRSTVADLAPWLKGTVSPDIGLHFRFWKLKLVLSAGSLMVLTFSYFAVPEI